MAAALISRLALYGVGYCALTFWGIGDAHELPAPATDNRFLDLPARWDTGWYVGLASRGYRWDGAAGRFENIAFFPAYPLVLGSAARALGLVSPVAWTWLGVSISTLFLGGALVALWVFAAPRMGPARANWCVALCVAYPFSVFFGLPYSESLFLLSVCLLFLAAEREWFSTALMAGVVAGLTRPTALVASLGMSVWWAHTYLSPEGSRARSSVSAKAAMAVAAMSPLLGTAVYSSFVYGLTGNPVMWALVQDGWGRLAHNPATALAAPLWAFVSRPMETVVASPELALNTSAAVFALASAWPIGKRLGWGLAAVVVAGVALPLSAGGVASLGRYTAVLFPIYVWLAIALPTRALPLVAGVFLVLQVVVASMFFTWRPMY